MDVRLGLVDVSHVHVLAGGGHHLHDPDRAYRTLGVLVELRLLVALRSHQYPIDVVLIAVFLEVLDQRQELLALLLGCRALHVLGILQVARQELVAGRGPGLVALREIIQPRLELRTVLTNRPRDLATSANRDVVVHDDLRKDLLPELRDGVVDDDERNQTGIEHLDQVLIFQCLGSLLEHNEWLLRCRQLLVECNEALVIARGFAHEHFFAGKVVHAGDFRRSGP